MSKTDPALWRDMMAYLRQKHEPICRQWFEELRIADFSGGLMQVQTSTPVQQNYLQKQCLHPFTEAAQDVTGQLIAVRFVNGPVAPNVRIPPPSAHTTHDQPHPLGQAHSHPPIRKPVRSVQLHADGESWNPGADQMVLSPDYSFENFITGPNNQLAYAASVAVSNQPGTAYNPLFIHGGVGLGKTHLLQAICQQILNRDPDTRILYVSCDSFMNHFIQCVQSGQMSEFRNRYRHVDMLVIDDIHFLGAGERERSQEEFFHTFNELYQSNRQIVLSSDAPPSEIPRLEERLVSRFQWGLVAQVAKPSFETRVAILRAKAQIRGMVVPDEVIDHIARAMDTNARELEGAITNLQGHASLGRAIDRGLAVELFGEAGGGPRGNHVSLQHIIDVVTTSYNVRLADLQSRRRHKSVTEPRQVCMWLARKNTRFSLEEIGGHFGGRDHTTVMHSTKTVDQRREQDPEYARMIARLDEQVLRTANTAGA